MISLTPPRLTWSSQRTTRLAQASDQNPSLAVTFLAIVFLRIKLSPQLSCANLSTRNQIYIILDCSLSSSSTIDFWNAHLLNLYKTELNLHKREHVKIELEFYADSFLWTDPFRDMHNSIKISSNNSFRYILIKKSESKQIDAP